MSAGKHHWQIHDSVDGQFFARFVSGNGRKVATTETYTSKANAYKGARVVNPDVPIKDMTKGRRS